MNLSLTKNCKRRSRQRGVNLQIISIIAEMADRTTHVGSGVVYKYLTRRRISELRKDGLDTATCERLARTSLLLNPETGDIITVFKGGPSTHWLKRYRQGRWFHQNPHANDNHRWCNTGPAA